MWSFGKYEFEIYLHRVANGSFSPFRRPIGALQSVPRTGGSLLILGYIDGGTGSIALQVLLAGALSAVYAFHTGWATIKNKLFKGRFSKQNLLDK
jgi:hypothetical protein